MSERDLYSEIIETTRALIVVLDVEGRIVMFNPACERMTGYRLDEVKGRHVWDFLLLPEELEGVKAVFNDLARGQFPNTYANYWITKAGERRWIEWSNSVVTDGRGKVVHIIGTGIDVTERQAVEAAQRRTQQRQLALLDGIPDSAWLKDLNGNYIDANCVFCERNQVGPREIIGKCDRELFGPDIAKYRAESDREVIRTMRPVRTQHLRLVSGHERWLDTIKTPIFDEYGAVIGIAGIARDITRYKQTEQLLREIQARQKALLDSIPDNAWLKDRDGRYIAVNQVFGEIFKVNPDTVAGRTDFDIFPELTARQFAAEDRAIMDSGVARRLEEHLVRQGRKKWVETIKTPIHNDVGEIIGIAGISRDVTERMHAESLLREVQQRQKTLLDGVPDAAWLVDADSRYIEVNRQFAARWGVSQSDVAGKTVFDIMPPPIAGEIDTENREILRTGETMHVERCCVIRGKTYWLDTIKLPVTDSEGRVTGIAGISRDITERKLAEAQRIARDAAQRDALVKEVHHRIKNNLQGTITLIQELASGHPESEDLLESAAARLNTIAGVHGLYGATGERELRLEQIIQTLVSSLQGLHGRPPMRLSVNSPLSALVSENEIVPLSLILNELIMNAIKHSRAADNDFVQIALESAGNGARIVIRNRSGKLPRHFNFDTGTGLGTGLALVQSLLPPSGMVLRFENAPGRPGTEVELTLCPPVITLLSPAASPSIATREPVHGAHPDRRG